MGKALKTIGTIAAAVALVATGVGAAAGAGIAAAGLSAAAAGVASVATLVSIAATVGGSLLTPAARRALTAFDPKAINPDPASPRKLVFGQTTFVVDLRYAEPSGTNQEYIDYIFALAAHKSDAITEIYIEDDLAWTVGGGAQGKYVGYLTVEVILEAGSGAYHTVNAGTIWGSSTRMTGCTTMKVRVKRSDNSKNSQSPFASGINGRWAVIGRGIPVYDPAQDSTVAGGSGAQRAATQTTWAYTAGTARGNNPALQLLTYLLGWRIGGVVSVGCGLPVDTIDLPSFATAAALCDETVALADFGSQRRYEAGRAFADSDDPLAVIRTLLDAMNGELVDDGGRLSLRLAVNDLTPSFTLTDDDFVSGYSWKPAAPIEQQYTVVRGRYSAPGATLYGLVDYPEVAIARTSLAPRPLTLELSAVQEPRRAERIAKQAAQRNLYQGTFSVTLGVRGWLLRRNMVVAVTSSARGWTAKLFRVRSLGFNDDATVDVVLREENAAIYAWSASESAQVTPVAPVVFDSRAAASWLMADIAAGANVTAPNAANRVPFSRMEGNQGYGVLYNPSSLANVVDYGEFQGLRFFKTTATATAAGQQISIGNAPHTTPAFKLTPGERVSVQARVEVAGAAAASYHFVLWGFEIDGVTQAVIASVSGGVNYIGGGVVSFFVDVPAWARQGRLELYGYSSGAGSFQVAISEPMVSGAVAGQTLHPAFTPGPNAKDGADVTAQNTAAAIAGQAWAATNGAQSLVDNRLVPVGSNAVVNSDFTRGKFGFGWGGGGFESEWGVNLPGTPNWFGQRNVMWATVSGVLASGTERDLSPRTIWQGFPSADAPLFALPVVPNERLFASVLAAAHRCTFVLYILIFDAAFNLISAPGVVGGRSGGAANGDPANFDLLTVTGDVPANARWAIPMFRMSGTGGTNPYIFFTEPMFGKMAAGQTVIPSYVSGRTDLLADRTADNTAANANALGGTAAATVAGNITTAGTTALWPNVTGTGRPADNADVTRTVLPALQRGAWSASSVAYALGDIVTRDGSSYTCIIANTSTGANGPPGANWALLANVGAQGPTGVSAPPIKSLSTGAAQLDPIRLVNGQTVTAAAELYLNTGGVAGVCSLELQISEQGAGSWATMTSGTVTDSQPTSEAVELVITGATFTNSGADRLFDIRAVSVRRSRAVNVPPSYLRVI